MNTVTVTTSQNVEIDFELASVGERLLAYIVDFIFIASFVLGMVFLLYYLDVDFDKYVVYISIGLTAPYVLYDLVFEVLLQGQSPAKKLFRIRVMNLDGSQPNIGSYLLRWILRLVDMGMLTPALALVTILINGKGQGIGDIAAGTTVVRLRERASLGDTILTRVNNDYKPRFLEAQYLDNKTVSVVKEVLAFERKNRRVRSAGIILNRTKKKVEDKLGISSGMEPREFLETIMRDYTHLSTIE
jgi:uncharacterized RDD family membrane protein YckC